MGAVRGIINTGTYTVELLCVDWENPAESYQSQQKEIVITDIY